MKNVWKKKISLLVRGWFGSLLIALLLATSIKSAVADWNVVPTGSMNPSIVEGDRIFVNKLAYDLKIPYTTCPLSTWDDPDRGDIVVFYSPLDGTRLVKRVVGLPGDSIAMQNNRLFINGKAVRYELLDQRGIDAIAPNQDPHQLILNESLTDRKHPVLISPYRPSFHSFAPIYVPEGHYFMMGDNRDNSADSRYFGFVERNRIIGQATAVVISLDHDNHYRPRWDRFFTKLP